jgi:hypothetical protein
MKRLFLRSIFIGSCALSAFACGGGSKSASNAIDDANDAADEATLETNSETAFAESDWSNQTPGDLNESNSISVSSSVQTSVSTIVSQATAGVTFSKNNKTATINHTVNGSLGGTAKVTGSYTMTSSSTGFPIDYSYDLKIEFDNFKEPTIAINGEITYSGTLSATDATHSTSEITINGGYSVLYQSVAYNVVTDIDVTITINGQSNIAITYSYTVNGHTYTGTSGT